MHRGNVTVGILTFQRTLNFGATLQNYALWKILKEIGFCPVVVDYRQPCIEKNEGLVFHLGPSSLRKWMRLLPKMRSFARFRNRMVLTSSCDNRTIDDAVKDFDFVIVGSDQVWNTKLTNSDPTYFLNFIDDPKRCKTYAASMGYGELPESAFNLCPLISHFSSILVREKSAADTIARECHEAPTAYVVLDPTLLVEKSVWKEIEKTPSYASGKPYVLVYDVSESHSAFDAAGHLAAGMDAQVIRIQSYDLKSRPGVKSVLNVSPEEYLGLFAHAQSTVVSSFHGLCFSIINHRDFYFSGQTTGKNTNSRATDLMDALGITGRTVQDLVNGTVGPIDWGNVEERLRALRAESLQLLVDSLSDLEEK